jgi:hypothetical protein
MSTQTPDDPKFPRGVPLRQGDVRRIADVVRRIEYLPRFELGDTTESADNYRAPPQNWVQITSLTQVAGRYPGTCYLEQAGVFTALATSIWVIEPNGGSLALSTYYRGFASGVANGAMVYSAILGSGSGGGGMDVGGFDSMGGAQDYSDPTDLEFSSTPGFYVSEAGSVVTVSMFAATASQAGYVSTSAQTFGGSKTFNAGVAAYYSSVISGTLVSLIISNWSGHYDGLYCTANSVIGGGTNANLLGWVCVASNSAGTTFSVTFYIDAQNARLVFNGNNGATGTDPAGSAFVGGLCTGVGATALTGLTDASSIAWNLAAAPTASLTLTGNHTLANPSNMTAGGTYILIVTQDGSGSHTLAYSSDYKWPLGTAPVLSTAPGAVDILTFVSDGTHMYGVFQPAFA